MESLLSVQWLTMIFFLSLGSMGPKVRCSLMQKPRVVEGLDSLHRAPRQAGLNLVYMFNSMRPHVDIVTFREVTPR